MPNLACRNHRLCINKWCLNRGCDTESGHGTGTKMQTARREPYRIRGFAHHAESITLMD